MTHTPPRDAQAAADDAQREEETLRVRWEATEQNLRQRFEAPISRATRITEATLAWFPVRVWRHFLLENGFLLSAGVSYVALFAFFAAIYLGFAITGVWLGGSTDAVDALIELINSYVPGLIAETGGIATPEQVEQIAAESSGVLGLTGVIALGTLVWTAIDFVTYSRRAVRELFAIPPDRRSYFLLKARDFVAALIFGAAIVLGFALSTIGTLAIHWVFSLVGWQDTSYLTEVSVSFGSLLIGFAVTSSALAGLFRFLTGTKLPWRRIWPGAMIGGIGISILQLSAGLLLSYTPSNPLLATFAIFVGLLLWFRLLGIVMLVGASWTAVSARDHDVVLLPPTEAERLQAEHAALLLAARVRLRTAQTAREQASWFRIWAADRAIREAEEELRQVEAAAPPKPASGAWHSAPAFVAGADTAPPFPAPRAASPAAPAKSGPGSKSGPGNGAGEPPAPKRFGWWHRAKPPADADPDAL